MEKIKTINDLDGFVDICNERKSHIIIGLGSTCDGSFYDPYQHAKEMEYFKDAADEENEYRTSGSQFVSQSNSSK